MSSVNNYVKVLQNLLPRGWAWTRRPDAKLTKLLSAFAEELNRVDCDLTQLIEEADPRTTSALFEDWERVLGLPDDCAEDPQTIAFRRARILSKLITPVNGQNVQFFIDLAALFGVTLTTSSFTDYQAFICGRGVCGEALTNGTWPYFVTIEAPAGVCLPFVCGSLCGERLIECKDDEFECVFLEYKPAHVQFDFNFV